ncbi:hypothetical protein [Blastococcus brunescens]|uniref:Chorismate-utilising enzyme C-terminal domain-containing protein n=1 Tax=Blastococcus brunescens TaxID=1564165 RepID=A0ABZ1B4I3_9ACTN|nr:hypothetical protein [Blastococcus sp. BMG 8361]WRL65713.1 hypothetical protein U6N30_09085 [Blastococcus sp. BMG 8361]
MSAPLPWARFDDLRGGTALLCPPAHRVLSTTRVDEVADVLREVQDATEAGSWAFGFVSYEAATGLDPGLPGGHVPGEPPLVWFGLCGEPARIPRSRPAPRPRHRCRRGGRTGPTPSTPGPSRRSASTSPRVRRTSAT